MATRKTLKTCPQNLKRLVMFKIEKWKHAVFNKRDNEMNLETVVVVDIEKIGLASRPELWNARK
jgi:hypothetical protein